MNDLIALSQQYTLQDTHLCNTCNVPLKKRVRIVSAKQMVVLKLDVWTKGAAGGDVVRRKYTLQDTHLLVFLILVLFVQTTSGSMSIIMYCLMNIGPKELKICI